MIKDGCGGDGVPLTSVLFDCYCDYPGCPVQAEIEVRAESADLPFLPNGWGRFNLQAGSPENAVDFDLCPKHFRAEVRTWMLTDPLEIQESAAKRVNGESKRGRKRPHVDVPADLLEVIEEPTPPSDGDEEPPPVEDDEAPILLWRAGDPPVDDVEEMAAFGG